MPQSITITVQDDTLVPRLVAAMRAEYPQYSSLTDAQCFKRITADFWRAILLNHEASNARLNGGDQAGRDAVAKAQADGASIA